MLVGEIWIEGYCWDDGEDEWPKDTPVGKHAAGLQCFGEESDGYEEEEEPEEDDGAEDVPDEVKESRGQANWKLGRRGEEAAARYLSYKGYEILERNYECPFGEADIIAREGETLVFVEVKTRKSISKGFPAEAVTPKKRARYEKIAAWYLRDYTRLDVPLRFDVIALLVVGEDRAMIKHYVDAFGAAS